MINKIKLNTVPFNTSFQTIDELKKVNYFFGSNGSGKTTISKVIDNPNNYVDCSIDWKNSSIMETRVYNSDFVRRNFNQETGLKGVFTLGEIEIETLKKISELNEELNRLNGDIVRLRTTLQGENGDDGKVAALDKLNEKYKDKFFTMKQKYAKRLSGNLSGEGVRGYISSKERFMQKVLDESLDNQVSLLSLSDLEEKVKTIFSNELTSVLHIPEIDIASILGHEKNLILQKRIIGKEDVDITAMIKKLGNSDWVGQGRLYFENNDGICPFCQQIVSENFVNSLNEYFDETFMNDKNVVNSLVSEYERDADILQHQVQDLINGQSDFIDIEKIKSEKQLLDSLIVGNLQKLTQKQREVSLSIVLDSLEDVLHRISILIESANKKINEHNNIIKNLRKEKNVLTKQIWKFVVEELRTDINKYRVYREEIEAAINSLKGQIENKEEERHQKRIELYRLEKQTTSIQPTLDSINLRLSAFGFKNFKLALGEKNTYRLVREDGSEAQDTLSEGEKSFITFLYFYHLLEGSQTETGLSNDKIVVIDDPISSLDNDVLFIVSTLIRELIQDVKDNKNSIKQIFILTHNIYFHKEVTFKKHKGSISKDETFWIVKKNGVVSTVEKQTENPIKTSYELLWNDIRNNTTNNVTIQNTLRRILENYFKLLGGIVLDKLYESFDGTDKIKCKALCSWINDGSHNVFDEEYFTSLDPSMVQDFLDIFKQIFQQIGHIAHYNMMMGIEFEDEWRVMIYTISYY